MSTVFYARSTENGCRSDIGKNIEWARRIGSAIRIEHDTKEFGTRTYDHLARSADQSFWIPNYVANSRQ